MTFFALCYGLLADFWLTVWSAFAVLCGLFATGCWLMWVWVTRRRRERKWLVPLHLAAHELAGIPRAIPARSWITVEMEVDDSVREVRLSLPQNWQADPKEEQRLVGTVAARAGIEAPETSWQRPGPRVEAVIRHGESPPPFIEYGQGDLGEQLAAAVDRASRDEIVFGLGKPSGGRFPPVKASLKLDSPHFMINMGSGGGKSELAAFLIMQELRRGSIVMVLDQKWHSQPWTFKDEFAEFSYLPNVAYLSSVPDLHRGMVWLGNELDRRNQVTRRAVDAQQRLHGNVGPRLFIIAEELNFATPQLKDYWAEIRQAGEPKKSPALTSLGAVSFAGRAVKMHLIMIGQMLTAEVTGSRDNSVKANVGVTAMARYNPSSWGTAIGKNVPMPPPPSVLGRIQLVTGNRAQETQTPKADYLLYRKLAISGVLTPCPAGMPRMGGVPDAPSLSAGGPDLPVVSETSPALGPPAVILSEAVRQRVVNRSLHAIRKASQRDPDFPKRTGMRGLAAEYDPRELAAWDAGRR